MTSECHHFSFQSTIYTYIHTHNLLVTSTNLDPHLVGIGDHHFAVHLIIGNHFTSNLVGPQGGIVEGGGLDLEHCCKQSAVASDLEDTTLLLLCKPPSFQQLKAIEVLPLLQCVRSHGKGQPILDMVLPTIPVREAEYKRAADTSIIVVDIHHHATELVALW